MENGWQQKPPAVPLLYRMNGDDELPMSVAAGPTASIAVGAIVSMTTRVSTAPRAASISAAMAAAAPAGVAVTSAGVAVAAVKVAIAASGVAIAVAIEAVATAGVAVVVKAPTVAATIVTIVGVASIIATSAAGEAVSATAIVAVVPRAGADKDAADKVVGTVESVRRALVGVVAVVSVGANGSYADVAVARADSNSNGNLSLGVTCRKHEKGK
jgi:hypothetical protein